MEKIGDWRPFNLAPRDGSPVVLWLKHNEAPPVYPVTVGFWITRELLEIRRWAMFGDPDGARSCSDEDICGWRPLLAQ